MSTLGNIIASIVNKINDITFTRQNLNYTKMTYVSSDTKHYATKYMQILGIDTTNMVSSTEDENIEIYLPNDSAVGHTLFIRHETGALGSLGDAHHRIKLFSDDGTEVEPSLVGEIEELFGSAVVYYNGTDWHFVLS